VYGNGKTKIEILTRIDSMFLNIAKVA